MNSGWLATPNDKMTNHWCSLFSICIVTLSLMRSFFVLLGRLEDNIHHVLWWHVATDKDDRWVGPNVSTTQLLYYLLSSFLSSHMPLVSMSSAEQLAIYPWKWLNLSSSLKSFSKSPGFLGKQQCLESLFATWWVSVIFWNWVHCCCCCKIQVENLEIAPGFILKVTLLR